MGLSLKKDGDQVRAQIAIQGLQLMAMSQPKAKLKASQARLSVALHFNSSPGTRNLA
jgi:hypothetical protein